MSNEEHTDQPELDGGLSLRDQIKSRLEKAGIRDEVDSEDPEPSPETTDLPIQEDDSADDDLDVRDQESSDEPGTDEDLAASDSGEPTVLTREEAELVMVETDDGPKPVSEIMRGDMREAHYTQQRQIQSKSKQALEGMLNDAVFRAAADATFLDEQLKSYENVNWEQLSRLNPEVYDREKPAFEALSGYRDQVVKRFEALKERAETIDKEQLARDWEETETNLKYTIPGWGDKLKAKRDAELKRRGFSADEMAKLADIRFQRMAIELAQLRVDSGKGKPKGKPKAVKPSSKGTSDKISRLRRAANKGDRDAAQALQKAGIESKLKRMGIP